MSQFLHDAAVVFRSLPEKQANEVLNRLDHGTQQRLAESVTALDSVSGHDFYRITRKFRDEAFHKSATTTDADSEDALLFGRGSVSDPEDAFLFLNYLGTDHRKTLLESEHPQNVALVISTLSPTLASSIMAELNEAFRISVLKRICEIEDHDSARIMELRYVLRMRAKKMIIVEAWQSRGVEVAAKLLSLSDPRTQDSILSWMTVRDQETASYLEYKLIRMDDLADLDDESLSALLKAVDTSAWAGALRSTVPSVAGRVLKAMAPRPAEIVSQEMASFNPLDVDAMQESVQKVVSVAIRLRDAGQLAFTGGPQTSSQFPKPHISTEPSHVATE